MSRFILRVLRALTLLALLIVPLAALAHEETTIGDYVIEYGWLNEPPVAGQPNSLIIYISGQAEGIDSQAEGINVDVSGLKVEVVYGGESKVLLLQPLADGAPGQFVAPFIPTRAGQYTVRLTGKLTGGMGDADANLEVQPEEVETADAYQFPLAAQQQSGLGLTDWLGIGGLVAGLLGLVLSIVALTRKK